MVIGIIISSIYSSIIVNLLIQRVNMSLFKKLNKKQILWTLIPLMPFVKTLIYSYQGKRLFRFLKSLQNIGVQC